VRVYADGKGERFLSADELARLGEALREAETIGLPWKVSDGPRAKHRPKNGGAQREIISPHAVAAIRLLLFTGCRAGEILNLAWTDVDAPRGFLHLRDSKTGAKKVWLSAPALQVLAEVPRTGEYVIAGAAVDKPRADLKRPWKRIIAHAGLPDLKLHDLRHSFASAGAASGMGLGMVGKLLGHASSATTARYAHYADNAAQAAADAIAGGIAAALAKPRSTLDETDEAGF
jgi:integrase